MNGLNEHGHFDRNWRYDAACRQEDPDLFVPISEAHPEENPTVQMAKEICRRCIVVEPCLKEALDKREPFGIWGGLSTPERNAILKRNLRVS